MTDIIFLDHGKDLITKILSLMNQLLFNPKVAFVN